MAVALVAVVTACTPPAAVPAPIGSVVAAPVSCTATTSAAPPESVSVALSMDVSSSHAPAPHNAAEAFVFAQLYETLLRVDCTGRVVGGLAQSWNADGSGRRWTLTLREGARFWNGDPLTARAVVDAWQAAREDSSRTAALARRLADSTTVVDERTIVVALTDTSPAVLTDARLAVSRSRVGSPWPEGTGAYRVMQAPDNRAGVVSLLPLLAGSAPHVTVRMTRDADARDQIDAGVHLLLTDDPRVVRYAASRADYVSLPLAWEHVYVVAVPRRDVSGSPVTASESLRRSLAQDAVRAEARAAVPPYWWDDRSRCGLPARPDREVAIGFHSNIIYDRADSVARQLAARLAALASVADSSRTTVAAPVSLPRERIASGARATITGLAPEGLSSALRTGSGLAFVIALPTHSVAPCDDIAVLTAQAQWIVGSGHALELTPLIETRARALVRRDGLSLVADDRGILRIVAGAPAGARAP
jgi:hypothetical protein